VKLARTVEDHKKLELRLDDVEHTQWLKQKADERKPKFEIKQAPQPTMQRRMKIS